MGKFEELMLEMKMKSKTTKDLSEITGVSKDRLSRARKGERMTVKTAIELFNSCRRFKDRVTIAFHYLVIKDNSLIDKLEKNGGFEKIVEILKIDKEINELVRGCILSDPTLEEVGNLRKMIKIYLRKNI